MDALSIPATVLGSGNIVFNKTGKSKCRCLPLLGQPIKNFEIKQVKNRHTFFSLLEIPRLKIWKDIKKKVKVIQNPFPQRWLQSPFSAFFPFWDRVLLCRPGWVQWRHHSSLQPQPPGHSHSPTSAPQVVGTAGTHHYIWLIFVFFVETGFCHVAQAGLKLLSSSHPLTSTFQSGGIMGVSHHTWPIFNFRVVIVFSFFFSFLSFFLIFFLR